MQVKDFYNVLKENKIDCFCGVPDSLLKSFCAYLTDNTKNHTITANEGNAIGLAAGHYLATGNPACVYMQNSGIGNCVNPLLSLTDEEVYNIPLLMLIGWRGEPGKKDEPQHIKQGKVTDKLLEVMGIKYEILPKSIEQTKPIIQKAFKYMKETLKPFALIIRKDTFEEYKLINKTQTPYELIREDAIETVIKNLNEKDIIVSTTGHISREVYETRDRLRQSHKQDFLTVGSMGHSSSIALGIALEKPDRNIYCFDGDGAFIMHEGAIGVNASKKLKNFKHIVFNNEAHDSVGSQPTVAGGIGISQIALNSGYAKSYSVNNIEDLIKILPEFISDKCTSLLEIKVKCGARTDLGRPKEKPQENKKIFMENLNQIEFLYRGSIENLSKIIELEKAKNVLVFTGKKSYKIIKPIVETELRACNIAYYNKFSTNPKEEDLEIAIKNLGQNFDIIIAVGGGSVIDFAKSYKYYIKSDLKLVAIPTTCGTGSEATQFAVLYKNGEKVSLDDNTILPDYAIVDSQFVENSPKYLKACTAMDAYCQAIESYWAIKSTPKSREYSIKAIELCRDNIIAYVNTNDTEISRKMMLASNLAGKAINISRTTAAHALSYKITSEYGIPHGHAVALSIAKLYELNTRNDKKLNDIITDKPIEYFNNLFKHIHISNDITHLGINNIDEIIANVNKERLINNPIHLSKEDLKSCFISNKETLN
jgi:phosphonopyruvate decarboxylase